MKFLADLGISPRTVEFLRDLGHYAVHLHDLGIVDEWPVKRVNRTAGQPLAAFTRWRQAYISGASSSISWGKVKAPPKRGLQIQRRIRLTACRRTPVVRIRTV